MHALGRVGCFFTGCCYGVELDPPGGIPVPAGAVGPGGVRFPVQLWEAGAEGVIFLLLLRYSRRAAPPGKSLAAYLLLYAPGALCAGVFRGIRRGFLGPLSTSQCSPAAAGRPGCWPAGAKQQLKRSRCG